MRTRAKEVKTRMTEEEFQKYQARLEKSKLTGNSYGLHCLLNHKINVVEDVPELIRQLKAIGNNLNQIARATNAGNVIPPPAVAELDEGVKELWQWLRRQKEGSR